MFAAQTASGQLRISSPYSRYGLGDLQSGILAHSTILGGAVYSLRDSLGINMHNPASLTTYDPMTFLCDIGLNSQFSQLQTTSNLQDYTNHTSLGYIRFAFPVTRWWGASLGLVPFSKTGYKMSVTDTVDNIGKVTGDYQGYGGLNRFYFGNGFKLARDLSFGLNTSFLFGTLTNRSAVYFNNLSYVFNSRISHQTVINDFNFEAGLQYRRMLKKRMFVGAGLVYQVPWGMRSRKTYLVETFSVSGEYEVTQDTIENLANQSGTVYLPGGLAGGLSFGQSGRWMLGMDAGYRNWKNFRNFGQEDSLRSSLYGSVGFCITPGYGASPNYFKQVTYSAGFRYQNTGLYLHSHAINEYAVSVGFNFPLRTRTLSAYSVKLAIEYGQRGTTKYNLIKESFVRFNLGFTIRESWFFRRKID